MEHVENPYDRFHMNQKSYLTIVSPRKISLIRERVLTLDTSSHTHTNPQSYIERWEIITRLRSDISLCKQVLDSFFFCFFCF
jgi:hypothetical protein